MPRSVSGATPHGEEKRDNPSSLGTLVGIKGRKNAVPNAHQIRCMFNPGNVIGNNQAAAMKVFQNGN